MIDYVMIYMVHPGNMGGTLQGPYRKVFQAMGDLEAHKIAIKQRANYSVILCVFRAEAEIFLK